MKCSICNRETPDQYQEDHHLDPKIKKSETIRVCCDCADQVHQLFRNNELHKLYNSLDKILANERIQKWVKWISKKREFGICMKRKK